MKRLSLRPHAAGPHARTNCGYGARSPCGVTTVKFPQTVTATWDKDRFLVASPNDNSRGLGALTLKRDDAGQVTSAAVASIEMFQPGNSIRIDRLNIQRAQSAVLVEQGGIEYAIVSDDNHAFADPYVKAMFEAPMFVHLSPFGPPTPIGGSASAKKVAAGGKLGIVQDPFGKLGAPKFLGATLPLDGYGIINLSLSEDGKVLIGQLKGGYSVNFEDSQQKPHQNHAWNVQTLITAALANQQPLSKHIKLAPSAAQLIPIATSTADYTAAPAGTAFDPVDVQIDVTDGRMGDVIEVDLKRRAAFALLGIKTVPPADQRAADPANVKLLINHIKEFVLEKGVKDSLTGAWEGLNSRYRDFTLATEATGAVLTRDKDGNKVATKDASRLDSAFETEGRLYLIPNISKADLERLRAGKTIGEKWATSISLKFQLDATAVQILKTNNAALASTLNSEGDWGKISLDVAARDFAQVENTFFGDRPLDNPGYSAIKLKGEVRTGSTDGLDILKIEQRLKYLGIPAFGTPNESGNTPANLSEAQTKSNDFKVDGQFTRLETNALKLFESVINYGTGGDKFGGTGVNKDGILQASNADGTTAWLNAYNAPHWMDVYHSLENQNGFGIFEEMGYKEYFGTSWMRDWLRGYSYADTNLQNVRFRFNGITDATLYGSSSNPTYGGAPLVTRTDNPAKSSRYGQTPHATHDVGMAFDLALKNNLLNVLTANNAVDPRIAAATLANETLWSKADANTLIGTATDLSTGTLNRTRTKIINGNTSPYLADYRSAIKDFLALYDVTQRDRAGTDTGSWEALPIANTRANEIRRALFGDGTQASGLIRTVLVGGFVDDGHNPQNSISAVLSRLGLITVGHLLTTTISTSIYAHQL